MATTPYSCQVRRTARRLWDRGLDPSTMAQMLHDVQLNGVDLSSESKADRDQFCMDVDDAMARICKVQYPDSKCGFLEDRPDGKRGDMLGRGPNSHVWA